MDTPEVLVDRRLLADAHGSEEAYYMVLPPSVGLSDIPADPSIPGHAQRIARQIAVSRVLAAEANSSEHVKEFRAEVLQSRLLSLPDVDAWIHQQAEQDGPPSYWLSGVPLSANVIQEGKDSWIHLDATSLTFKPYRDIELSETPSLYQRHVIYLRDQGILSMTRVPVTSGGVLDRLRKTADLLEHDFRWDKAPAAAFLLTGMIPYAWQYAEALEHLRGRKPREMGLKSLELAVFTSERPKKEPLAARLAAWKALHPDWAFERTTNFGWQSQDALRRLIGTDDESAQLRKFGPQSGWLSDRAKIIDQEIRERAHSDFQAELNAMERGRGPQGRRQRGHTA